MSNNTYFPCYNCGAEIKDGTFKSNNLFSKNDTAIINEYSDNPKNGYCDKCGLKLFKEAELKLKAEKSSIKEEIRLLLDQIPIFTIQYLPNWEYKVLGMVTGQSTTGTGIITEFTSSFTDFFGEQSKKHNAKLKAGEMLSSYQMRSHTFEMGGNAIIGVDIDYTDSGDGKGMLSST